MTMNLELVEKIADAILYEGYMLYPYRASSVKNRQRFNWGALAPKSYCDAQKGTEAWEMQTECLVVGDEKTEVIVKLRFLLLTDREIGKIAIPSAERQADFELVPSLEVNGRLYQEWQEGVEHEVDMPAAKLDGSKPPDLDFSFPATRDVEGLRDAAGNIPGVLVRTQSAINGRVQVRVADCGIRKEGKTLFKITIKVQNTTPFKNASEKVREDALLSSIVSTHTILSVNGGEFVSLLEPPDEFAEAAAFCENIKTYPVLAGEDGDRTCMLSSPIILYDYPQIAPESAGDLFDGAEIDEILTLRIMTLTDEEKCEMRGIDDRARKILERTELMPEEQLLKMHGAMRGLNKAKNANYG